VEVDEFGDIIIKPVSARGTVRPPASCGWRDVGRIELGSQQYDQSCTLNGKPSVALSIYQCPRSNAIKTAQGVYAKMEELKQRFPEGLDYQIVYDTTPFIKEIDPGGVQDAAPTQSCSWPWSS